MSHQIILQPNGLFAIWSTVVDDILVFNLTVDLLISENHIKHEPSEIRRICKALKNNEKPYHQFTKSWKEVSELIKIIHNKNTDFILEAPYPALGIKNVPIFKITEIKIGKLSFPIIEDPKMPKNEIHFVGKDFENKPQLYILKNVNF